MTTHREVKERNRLVNSWIPDIQKAARRAGNEWPGVADQEDMAQEICVKILEAPGTIRDLAGMDDDARYRTLHKIAQRIASQWRTDLERFSGNFRYSVDEVRDLLEEVADDVLFTLSSSWNSGQYIRDGGSSHCDPTANTAVRHMESTEAQRRLGESLYDLRAANERQFSALVRRFGERIVPSRQHRAEHEMIRRALVSLTTRMNHGNQRQYSPARPVAGDEAYNTLGDGPGSRRAIRNSTARFLSKEGWDADYLPAPAHLRDNHIEPEVWR